ACSQKRDEHRPACAGAHRRTAGLRSGFHLDRAVYKSLRRARRSFMSARNKFAIMISIILLIAALYYFISTPGGKDLVLVGTVDSNQIVVSPQINGRIAKLLVDEGTQVKQGDLIAILDPSELEAEERAAAATIASLKSKVSESHYTERAT